MRRLDRGSGAAHRPATAIADNISANRTDPVAQALWQAHVERALLSAEKLKAGWPQPRLSLRDPMALRALVVLLAVAAFVSAGGERWKRITAAFDWKGVVAPANFRIDAWVTPPLYTGRPPVMLQGVRPGEATETADLAGAPISVPAGSQLIVRSTGKVSFDTVRVGAIEPVPRDPKNVLPAGTDEQRFVIKSDGSVTLHGVGGREPVWTFSAIPDRAPTVAFLKDPERQARARCASTTRWTTTTASSKARRHSRSRTPRKQDDVPRPATPRQGDGKPRHPLFPAPEFALTLPQARTRSALRRRRRISPNIPGPAAM